MKVFVTGAAGLLGTVVVRYFLEKGYQVKGLVRDLKKVNRSHPNLEFVEGDILDMPFLLEETKGMDFVVHTAAIVSFAPKDRREMHRVNVKGTENVVNACLDSGVKKLCHVSSIAAFGRPPLKEIKGVIEVDENQKWVSSATNSNYAISKYMGELEVWRGAGEGLNMVIVNPSIILAEGDWNTSSAQLFKYAYDERPFYPEGYINYVDVEDVADAIVRLTESDISNERFCLSADMVSYKEFFDTIAAGFGKKKPHLKVNSRLMGVLWRFEALKAFITREAPLITKETAKTSQLQIFQKNDKIKKALNFDFNPLDKTVERICGKLVNLV